VQLKEPSQPPRQTPESATEQPSKRTKEPSGRETAKKARTVTPQPIYIPYQRPRFGYSERCCGERGHLGDYDYPGYQT
jgi:hypothetical protein